MSLIQKDAPASPTQPALVRGNQIQRLARDPTACVQDPYGYDGAICGVLENHPVGFREVGDGDTGKKLEVQQIGARIVPELHRSSPQVIFEPP